MINPVFIRNLTQSLDSELDSDENIVSDPLEKLCHFRMNWQS